MFHPVVESGIGHRIRAWNVRFLGSKRPKEGKGNNNKQKGGEKKKKKKTLLVLLLLLLLFRPRIYTTPGPLMNHCPLFRLLLLTSLSVPLAINFSLKYFFDCNHGRRTFIWCFYNFPTVNTSPKHS